MDFVIRQQPTSDELPPWAGIIFKYPVDSDDLSEKLKAAYPDCKTLRERKHRVTIDFFTEELAQMQAGKSTTRSTSVISFHQDSQEPRLNAPKSKLDVLSESGDPVSPGDTSPLSHESPEPPETAEQERKGSSATANPGHLQLKASTTQAQQFVWNSHDGRFMRPKTKRKMTVEERSAYKETRKRGACDKCRRQKGRCTHMSDGDPWQSMTGTNQPRRSVSDGMDGTPQDAYKALKMEYGSDVHHETRDRHHLELQPATSHHGMSNTSVIEASPREKQKGDHTEKYVQSQNLISPFGIQSYEHSEPWPTLASHDPIGPVLPEFRPELDAPHAMPFPQVPQASGFSFPSGMKFYGNPWIMHKEQPQDGNPPDSDAPPD